MTGVVLLLLAVVPRPALGLAFGICAPDSARQAYDELLAAAPDGSELERQARGIADDARARGAFDSDDTTSQLDELARGNDYAWDCQGRVYQYAPPEEDPSGEDEAAVMDSDSAGTGEVAASDVGSLDGSGVSGGSDDAAPQEEAFADESVTVPGASRSDPGDRGNRSPVAEATARPRLKSGAPTQEAVGGSPPTSAMQGSSAARLSVDANPEGHDRGIGPSRWLIVGGLVATSLVVWRRRR